MHGSPEGQKKTIYENKTILSSGYLKITVRPNFCIAEETICRITQEGISSLMMQTLHLPAWGPP